MHIINKIISGYWLVDKDGNLIPDPAKAPDEQQTGNPEDFKLITAIIFNAIKSQIF